jgi:hypothetical protein
MGMLHSKGESQGGLSSPIAWDRLRSDFLGKAATVCVLKYKKGIPEMDPKFVNVHDIRVSQRSDGYRLDAKPSECPKFDFSSSKDHLQGDEAAVPEILCLIDDAHASTT